MAMRYAKDEKCCECGKQASKFFPCVDPDIPAYPYCLECLNKAQVRLLKIINKAEKEFSKKEEKK